MAKKEKIKKTNALRYLDMHHIPYEVATFVYEEGRQSGLHAAEEVGRPPESVFKTLVALSDKGEVIVFCIPVSRELDLKKAAQVSGHKSVHMLPLKDLLTTTGYVHGGCSPIGMKKDYPVFMDATATQFPIIALSAGQRGMQMLVAPQDIISVRGITLADLTHA